MHLSKSERRIARKLIDIGLQKEFRNGMEKFHNITSNWKTKGLNAKESYYEIFKAVKNFDKHIARRYDGMTGSKYMYIVAEQLGESLITENDIREFSEETQAKIKLLAGV